MPVGTVKWFGPGRGYGTIVSDGGGDEVFVQTAALASAGLSTLVDGQGSRFDFKRDRSGISSGHNVRLLFCVSPTKKAKSFRRCQPWNDLRQELRLVALVAAVVLGVCRLFATMGDLHWVGKVSLFALCATVLCIPRALR